MFFKKIIFKSYNFADIRLSEYPQNSLSGRSIVKTAYKTKKNCSGEALAICFLYDDTFALKKFVYFKAPLFAGVALLPLRQIPKIRKLLIQF